MKKITFFMILVTAVMFLGAGVFSKPLSANTTNAAENSYSDESYDSILNIMTTNKPIADMVNEITKNKHSIQYMLKDEADIKDYKYTNDVINNVSNMDLFFYTGTSFEPWKNNFISDLKKGNLGIINLSKGIRITKEGSQENPYYFTGIEEYKIALYNIKKAVQDKDPKNRDFYEKNYNDAIENLDKMTEEYKEILFKNSDITFITLNGDFDYLLDQLSVKKMQLDDRELSEFIKMNQLNPEKVIIIDDRDNPSSLNLAGYHKAELAKYDGNLSFVEVIENNLKAVTEAEEAVKTSEETEENEADSEKTEAEEKNQDAKTEKNKNSNAENALNAASEKNNSKTKNNK